MFYRQYSKTQKRVKATCGNIVNKYKIYTIGVSGGENDIHQRFPEVEKRY